MSRRAAWLLIALCAWTLYVWITRIVIMSGEDHSAGFLAVHTGLALVSIAFGCAAGWIGWRVLRGANASMADRPASVAEQVGPRA